MVGAVTKWQYRQATTSAGVSSATWNDITSTAETLSYVVRNLGAGITYYFQIRAVNSVGNGTASSTLSATPTGTAPTKAINASAESGNAFLTLAATTTGSVTKWQYRQATTSAGVSTATWTDIASTALTLSYNLTGLTNSTTYYVQVRAVNGGLFGTASDTFQGTPKLLIRPNVTETTRINLAKRDASGAIIGSNIWYRNSSDEDEIPLPRVKKITTRIGDDARTSGPFRLSAGRMKILQIHPDPDFADQTFINVDAPGILSNIDGQVSDTHRGAEIVQAYVEKSKERVVDFTTVDREITALGAWSRVVDQKASTEVFVNIKVSDAIKRVLEAVGAPYGEIEDSDTAVLDYFWLSNKQSADRVLLGLAEAGGLGARLDDYSGVISFQAAASETLRLPMYGGKDVTGWSTSDATVGERTPEGTGIWTSGSGVLPSTVYYGGYELYQASLGHRVNRLTGLRTFFTDPYRNFTYNSREYKVEQIKSGYDSTKNRYYIEVQISNETDGTAFTATTFNTSGVTPIYANFLLDNTTYTKKRLSDATSTNTWSAYSTRSGRLGSVVSNAEESWRFYQNQTIEAQAIGFYRLEITADMADSVGAFTFLLTGDKDAALAEIEPPSESQRIIFQNWRRNNDDTRYFNTIRLNTAERTLEATDGDLWASPENIEVAATESVTIEVSSTDGTPFLLATTNPFTYTANANLASITANRKSGSEIEVTITAGSSDLTLVNLKVRGKYYVRTREVVFSHFDQDAVARDGEVLWESAGVFPESVEASYLSSLSTALIARGLERRWTCTLEVITSNLPSADAWQKNNWQTMMRLRPGRLVRIDHSRGNWLGIVREIERTSGVDVQYADRYKVTCELTDLEEYATNILRAGLDTYGSDKRLG